MPHCTTPLHTSQHIWLADDHPTLQCLPGPHAHEQASCRRPGCAALRVRPLAEKQGEQDNSGLVSGPLMEKSVTAWRGRSSYETRSRTSSLRMVPNAHGALLRYVFYWDMNKTSWELRRHYPSSRRWKISLVTIMTGSAANVRCKRTLPSDGPDLYADPGCILLSSHNLVIPLMEVKMVFFDRWSHVNGIVVKGCP